MPGMDGFEATHRIRDLGCRDVPIIAVTANAMTGDRERCIREGMNDYLAKPTQLSRLAEVLEKWLPESSPADIRPTSEQAAVGPCKDVFDEQDLLNRLVRDRHLASRIIRGFLEDCPSMLSRMRKLLEEGDGPGAALQAHALMGAAAAVSAGSLRAVAAAMERAGKAGDLDNLGRQLPRAIDELAQLKRVLERAGWI